MVVEKERMEGKEEVEKEEASKKEDKTMTQCNYCPPGLRGTH